MLSYGKCNEVWDLSQNLGFNFTAPRTKYIQIFMTVQRVFARILLYESKENRSLRVVQ